MMNRKALRPNNQTFSPVLGSQFFVRYPKAIERQSTYSWDTPGRGQQGESVTGGSNKSKIIRKGTSRAT